MLARAAAARARWGGASLRKLSPWRQELAGSPRGLTRSLQALSPLPRASHFVARVSMLTRLSGPIP